jgi:hypothetical protein
MSWKSYVTAALLCVIASPAFAEPLVEVIPGGTQASGHLNDDGDWVWLVRLHQTDDPIIDVDNDQILPGNMASLAPGSPLGAELGFQEVDSEFLDAEVVNGTEVPHSNPGRKITGWDWLTLMATGGTGDCNTGTAGLCPHGLQESTDEDQVFAALGSTDYLADDYGRDWLRIVIDGPNTNASLTTNLEMLGAYGGNGRIGELNDNFNPALPTSSTNPFSVKYDMYALDLTRTAKAGDMDLDGDVDVDDYQAFSVSYHPTNPGKFWYTGDFNGDGIANIDDYQLLSVNFGPANNYVVGSGGSVGGGAGGGGVTAIPEPTAIVLALMAGAMFLGRRARS